MLTQGQITALETIRSEVGEWSQRNFGAQTSKATGQELRSIAPLLGLFEEIGELTLANAIPDFAEQKDALADCFIYLCDFMHRENVNLPLLSTLPVHFNRSPTILDLYVWVGKLTHVVLKRHQGIRGYAQDEKYFSERDYFIAFILEILRKLCSGLDLDWLDSFTETWNKVKSRDWEKNPENAANVETST